MAHKIHKRNCFVCSMSTAHLAFYDALLTLFSFQGTTRTDALVSRTYHGRYALSGIVFVVTAFSAATVIYVITFVSSCQHNLFGIFCCLNAGYFSLAPKRLAYSTMLLYIMSITCFLVINSRTLY
ncbi:hypothetical protein SRRS_49790 [Sporomusa rhizae]